ncbi:hypothetical protein [Mycoplasma amphoriforme]|uniref:hypothetical protein n=1 Tax=Mycoplasma amphoriforme TaxID=273136 RepID=UPI0031BB9F95
MKLKKLKWFTLLGFSGIVTGVAAACANVKQDDGNKVRNQNSTEMNEGQKQQSPGQAQNPNNQNQAGQSPAGNTNKNTPPVRRPEANDKSKQNKQSGQNENNKMDQNTEEMQKGKESQSESKDNKPKAKEGHFSLEATAGTDTITQKQLQENKDFMLSKKNFDKFKEIIDKAKSTPHKSNPINSNGDEIEKAQIQGINEYLKTLPFNEELLKDYLIVIISNEIGNRALESDKISKVDFQYSFTNTNDFSFKITIDANVKRGDNLTSFQKKWSSSDKTKYDSNNQEGVLFTNVIVDDIGKNDQTDPGSKEGIPIFIVREISNMFFSLSQIKSSK